jgi:two-component system, sensor histidine kinase RegB
MAVAAHELERHMLEKRADQTLAADAKLIRAEIDRCRAILNQMAGRLAEPIGEAPRAAALDEVVTAALARFQPSERARITTDGDRAIGVVWPIGVVAQALGNLLRNALQASAPESAVRIGTERLANANVRITVSDRGVGMRPDELARAGEPFFTTKPPGVGTGLGLFVTRSSIEQLGGHLTLASRPGEGTTVSITLPHDVLGTAQAT